MEHSEFIVKTKDVIGVDVKNIRDEDLGKVEEIMLDKHNGIVRYVVLSFGGFLGMGDKLFAVPWAALDYNADKACFVLNVEKDKLKNAPGFNKDHWPNTQDRSWGQGIFEFYGVAPYWNDGDFK